MSERFVETLLKRMNIKSVYYYNSNHVRLGRVDDKFVPEWSKFVAGHNDRLLVVNNHWLGDTLLGVAKQLFINFTIFDDDDKFTLIYKENEEIDVKTLLAHMVDGQTTFVNMDNFTNKLLITYPFRHVVIDDFLQSDKLPKILNEVNNLQDTGGHAQSSASPHEFNTYAMNSNYGSYLMRLFVELNSREFIKYVERITGVNNIICNDLFLYRACGIHRIKSKGFSQLHNDFNTYHSKNRRLDRRVNLLIYLNPDWKPDQYKGALCLCDKNTSVGGVKKIDPILNRCVIFNTTSSSIYGHPEPLDGVVGQQYIAVNYYTENMQRDGDAEVDFEGAVPRNTTWYPDIDVCAKPTQIFYV
jgi:Rps23 Pro-64 3,4-dihydroxylase Tpa1-like proline 4-hydroxylase